MNVVRTLVSLACGAMLTSGAAQAAQTLTITFPANPQSFTLGPIAQQTNFASPTSSVISSLSGYGLISAFTNSSATQICGGTNCQFTFVYGGFSNTGATGLNNQQLFTGGSLKIYLDVTTSSSTPPGTASATAFTNSASSYSDGLLFLDLRGHNTTQTTKTGGNVTSASTTSSQVESGKVNGVAYTDPAVTQQVSNTYTGTTGAPVVSTTSTNLPNQTFNVPGIGTVNITNRVQTTTTTSTAGSQNNVSLLLSDLGNGAFSGTSYYDVVGGLGASLFNNNSQFDGSDLAATISFTSATQCSAIGVSPYYCIAGGGTATATAIPPTITIITVPEPASLALGGLALLGLASLRRRKAAHHPSA